MRSTMWAVPSPCPPGQLTVGTACRGSRASSAWASGTVRVAGVAVVILAVALGVAVIVAAVAVARARALSHHVAEVQARADGSRAKVVAGLEREAVMEERHEALSAEHTALETTLREAEAERVRLQLAVDDSSGEVARLDDQLAVMGDSLANAQAAAREADAAAVAAVAAADATHDDLIKTRNEVER